MGLQGTLCPLISSNGEQSLCLHISQQCWSKAALLLQARHLHLSLVDLSQICSWSSACPCRVLRWTSSPSPPSPPGSARLRGSPGMISPGPLPCWLLTCISLALLLAASARPRLAQLCLHVTWESWPELCAFVYMSAKQCWSKAALLYKLGISTLWMFVLPGMHPDYCYMLSGSCTLPPCSCSPLGCSMRLPCFSSLPPMPDSVYTSLENGDQSCVPLSTNQPSCAV